MYQCIATADGTTALTYARDNSMRSLLLDKIARSELIVFNRAEKIENYYGFAEPVSGAELELSLIHISPLCWR